MNEDKNILLLWQFQDIERQINEIGKEKVLEKIYLQLRSLKEKYNNKKAYLNDKICLYRELEKKTRKIDLTYKDLSYQIEKLQSKIYDGNINNADVLSKLNNELKDFKVKKDNLEEEILETMESIDIVKEDIKNFKNDLLKLQKQYTNKKEDFEEKKADIIKKKNILVNKLQNIEQEIEKKYISSYINIQKSVNPPMSLVRDGICTGCNMNISIIFLNEIKEKPAIHCCENCGRILYLEKR